VRGLPAWAEDRIDTLEVGEVTLQLVKPCTRCSIPSRDPCTGEPSTGPAAGATQIPVRSDLRGVTFGENAVIVRGTGCEIRCGAQFRVSLD